MDIELYLKEQRGRITRFLTPYIEGWINDPILVGKHHRDAYSRLGDFSLRGKMIRGGLVSLGCRLFSKDFSEGAVRIGTAMELLQSALLIHDDIMDQDEVRRGVPTLYKQYADISQEKGVAHPVHTGMSLGICSGDIAIFLAYDLMNRLDADPQVKTDLLDLVSREMLIVGTAQMDDVAWGADPGFPSINDVVNLYRHKTGRYTFSLPLCAGAVLAGQPLEVQEQLMDLGENLGILFQIRDDELGLTGDESKLGKPVGSDIREGKKTIHYLTLTALSSDSEKARLKSLFGNRDASSKEIQWVLNLLESYRVTSKVADQFSLLDEKIEQQIGNLPVISEEYRDLLYQLYTFVMKRDF